MNKVYLVEYNRYHERYSDPKLGVAMKISDNLVIGATSSIDIKNGCLKKIGAEECICYTRWGDEQEYWGRTKESTIKHQEVLYKGLLDALEKLKLCNFELVI